MDVPVIKSLRIYNLTEFAGNLTQLFQSVFVHAVIKQDKVGWDAKAPYFK